MALVHNLKSALHLWQVLTRSLFPSPSSTGSFVEAAGFFSTSIQGLHSIVLVEKVVVVREFILFVFFLCLKNSISTGLHHK